MYIYIYIYTYIHTYTYTQTCNHTCIHTCMHARNMHTQTPLSCNIRMHADAHQRHCHPWSGLHMHHNLRQNIANAFNAAANGTKLIAKQSA